MSIDLVTYRALNDELTKIAFLKSVGKMVRRGWDDLGGIRGSEKIRGGGWLGKQDSWRKNLPIGGKSVATGLTAAMVPSALGKQDPLGRKRSRSERTADMSADVGGSLLGAGAMLTKFPGKRFGLLKSIGGAIGGSLLGSRVATTPWRMARERANRPVLTGRERQNLMTHGVPQ